MMLSFIVKGYITKTNIFMCNSHITFIFQLALIARALRGSMSLPVPIVFVNAPYTPLRRPSGRQYSPTLPYSCLVNLVSVRSNAVGGQGENKP